MSLSNHSRSVCPGDGGTARRGARHSRTASPPPRRGSQLVASGAFLQCRVGVGGAGTELLVRRRGRHVGYDRGRIPAAHRGGVGVRLSCRRDGPSLCAARGCGLDGGGRGGLATGRGREAPESQRALRHARQRLGVVLGPARPRPLRRLPGVPRRRLRRRRLERSGIRSSRGSAAYASRRRGVEARSRRLRHHGSGTGLVGAKRSRACFPGWPASIGMDSSPRLRRPDSSSATCARGAHLSRWLC